MELYGRIKPCTAACAPSSIVQRSIAETISLKSNFAVVWEARYGIEETRLIWSKQSASNLWRPYANLYTLCVLWWSPIDGKLYHFYFLFSSSSYRYILCCFYCYSVLSKLSFLYHRRKLNYQIWDVDKRS